MNKTILTTAVVSAVAGGALGGIVTYVTVNKALRTRYEDWANEQIDSVKKRYSLLRGENGDLTILDMAQHPSPEIQAAVDKGRHLIEQAGYATSETTKEEGKTKSIFDLKIDPLDMADEAEDEGDEPDHATEDSYVKIEGEPFKIEEEEYFENVDGYSLDTLTYYATDDTLCDENNSQIERVQETIGARHLHLFDKGKQPKTSIYIQNDDHQTLYEIILIESSYASVVLGMDDETLGIKAPKERPRKMRDGD